VAGALYDFEEIPAAQNRLFFEGYLPKKRFNFKDKCELKDDWQNNWCARYQSPADGHG
jgi:hypothetical protein